MNVICTTLDDRGSGGFKQNPFIGIAFHFDSMTEFRVQRNQMREVSTVTQTVMKADADRRGCRDAHVACLFHERGWKGVKVGKVSGTVYRRFARSRVRNGSCPVLLFSPPFPYPVIIGMPEATPTLAAPQFAADPACSDTATNDGPEVSAH